MSGLILLLIPLCVAGFVFYVLVRTLPHLPQQWRRRVFVVFASLYAACWALMDVPIRCQFRSEVRAMHERALDSLPDEVGGYKKSEPNLDPKYIEHLQSKVYPKPWYSLWSCAPVPFVLVTSENYQLGPLWGLGLMKIYVFTGTGIRCIFEGRTWIS